MAGLSELLDNLSTQELESLEFGDYSPELETFLVDNIDDNDVGSLGELLGVTEAPASGEGLPTLTPEEQALQGQVKGEITTAPSAIERAAFGVRDIAAEGIPLATSIAGGVGGAVGGAPIGMPVAGGFAGAVGGEVLGQEIVQGLGLKPDIPIAQTGREALFLETVGGGVSALGQHFGKKFLPVKVVDFLRKVGGKEANEFIAEQTIRERIVGEGEETVTESLERLSLSEEAKLGLTTTQRTEGVAGVQVAGELATRERIARDKGVKGAFGLADEQLRKELEAKIVPQKVAAARIKGEDFTSAFNGIINQRNKDISESLSKRGKVRANLANKSKEVVDFGGRFRDALTSFESEVTGFDVADKELLFNKIREILPEDTTKMSLRDVDNLLARFKSLSGTFSENKEVQNEVAGIVSRFRKNHVDPILSSEALEKVDVARFVQNNAEILSLQEQRNVINNAKSVIATGVTEFAQGKKAKSSKQILSTVFASPESYVQFKGILEDAGQSKLLGEVEDAFVSDILNKSVKNASELGKKGAKSLSSASLNRMLEDVNTSAMIRTIKGDAYFENLQRVQNVLAARDSSQLLISSLAGTRGGGVQQTMNELVAQFGLAKLTKHSLRAATSLLAIMDKTVQNVMGLRGKGERELLEFISDPKNISEFDKLIEVKLSDPRAYGLVQGVLRKATGTFLTRDEFGAIQSLAEQGAFDKVPVEENEAQ